MTQIHWTNAIDGLFSDASDWTGGAIPGAGDTAILDAPGASPYTVTASASETVEAIKTASNATLDITGGTFSATGAMSGVNAGAIVIGDSSQFSVGGQLRDTGSITIGNAATINGPSSLNLKSGGTLIRSGGTGFGYIEIAVVDAGSIVAAGGNLVISGALTGTGSLMVDSGARLYAQSKTAATLSMVFSGPDAVLDLGFPKRFRATINGFAPTDAIDLGGRKATSAVLEAGDKLVITNGTNAVATLQLAGDYTGDTFNLASDGNGGTNITVTAPVGSPPAARALPFVAAMAGLRRSAGASVHTSGAWRDHEPFLASPRAATA